LLLIPTQETLSREAEIRLDEAVDRSGVCQ
jgi:hypothetical protein